MYLPWNHRMKMSAHQKSKGSPAHVSKLWFEKWQTEPTYTLLSSMHHLDSQCVCRCRCKVRYVLNCWWFFWFGLYRRSRFCSTSVNTCSIQFQAFAGSCWCSALLRLRMLWLFVQMQYEHADKPVSLNLLVQVATVFLVFQPSHFPWISMWFPIRKHGFRHGF